MHHKSLLPLKVLFLLFPFSSRELIFYNFQLVVEQAINKSNEYAVKALLYHYLYTVRAAANLAVCFSAQGVFLAGDNQVSNKAFVCEHFNYLYNEEFKRHPKSKWIDNIPIYSQIEYLNLNIEGTLHICRNELAKK